MMCCGDTSWLCHGPYAGRQCYCRLFLCATYRSVCPQWKMCYFSLFLVLASHNASSEHSHPGLTCHGSPSKGGRRTLTGCVLQGALWLVAAQRLSDGEALPLCNLSWFCCYGALKPSIPACPFLLPCHTVECVRWQMWVWCGSIHLFYYQSSGSFFM